MIPYFSGETKESPRNAIVYFSDDGDVIAVRVGDYKFQLAVQRAVSTEALGRAVGEAAPAAYHEPTAGSVREGRVGTRAVYWKWVVNHIPQMYLMQAVIARQIEDFAKFPPRQKPASFNLDAVLEQVKSPHG